MFLCENPFTLILALHLGMFLSSGAALAQQVQAMKLLTARVGWALSGRRLYWTTDGGSHWKDITPAGAASAFISSPFFLDRSTGWVVLSNEDDQERVQFRVGSTHDAGANWSISPLKLPWKRYSDDFAGGAYVFFLDRFHGWMKLDLKSSSSFAIGPLLVTTDGGRIWKVPAGDSGESGSLCFFSQADGILSGGAENSELWVTHDGSRTWQQFSLKAPAAVSPAQFPTYGEPTCRSAKNGFLPVTYSGPDGADSALVLFVTADAGRTWKASSVVPHLDGASPGQTVPSALFGTTLIAATKSGGKIALTIVDVSGEARHVDLNGLKGVTDLSFADMSHGWVLAGNGMFSTVDGGASWTEITPTRSVSAHDHKAN